MINEFVKKQIDHIKAQCKVIKPLVAIRCITYNHELYLRDALESFVMQKTDFPFVAIIHEDASTDRTVEILKEFQIKYPHIIFPIYEKENQYSKSNDSLREIMNMGCEATGAKFVALCEGDDYWIDPFKLQKQVDFLTSHPDYSLCFSKSKVISSDASIKTSIYDHLEEKEYSADEIIKKWTIPTATALIRKEVFKNIPYHPDFCVGDNVVFLTAANQGKIYCLNDITSVYRRQSNGWYLKNDKSEIIRKMLLHHRALRDIFKTLKLPSLKKLIVRNTAFLTVNNHYDNKNIKIALKTAPLKFILYLLYFKYIYKTKI